MTSAPAQVPSQRRTHLSTMVPQPLHRELRLMAILEGISLNDLVLRALETVVAQAASTEQHLQQEQA
jgi:predicted HicB family RNase H-like nuclease